MSFEKWRHFLNEAPKRSSPAGIRRSLNTLLNTGPHSDGSPYKDEDEHLKGKKNRNQISAPPGQGDVGGWGAAALEEEVEEETFQMQSELQPEIWHDNRMWPEVRERLLEIVDDFLEGLEIEVPVEDVRLTGSLANYNWSKYSDVDLHIVVDFSQIDEDTELVKSFFDAARARWNDLHAITVYGFEVELYVENTGDIHHSSGVYSVERDKWIVEPTPRDVEIDFATARKKSDDIETRVNLVSRILENDEGKTQIVLKMIERIKHKIRRMRQAGLDSPQKEFSPENIAFKILRRNGTLERLSTMKHNTYDAQMSLPEERDEISRD
tara:strand:- start:4275 stop:5246 length:972 start_codon:yes stop_codon:yes gene_type:complete